jgi:hypothetical protein
MNLNVGHIELIKELRMESRKTPLLGQTDGARELVRAVETGFPYAAGKLGTSELDALCWYITHRQNKIQSARTAYPLHVFRHMVVNAGLFPARPDVIDAWCEHMFRVVLPTMDLMVEWNPTYKLHEHYFLETHAPHSKRTVLRALEPYYEDDLSARYTLAIPSGSKVAIISPFFDTILEQGPKLHTIWPDKPMWNESITCIPIQTFFSPLVTSLPTQQWPGAAGTCWEAACDMIVDKVRAVGAKYALVGCGALSLPIVAALKTVGCIAIHTGGATQIMFGIKGRRWDNHGVISKFYNDSWIRPAHHEIPEKSAAIENGCYF